MDKLNFFSELLKKKPVNIEAIIRNFDILLDKDADLHSDISGELRKLPDGTFKISIQRTDHYYRKRFTMAHEFGHFMLHKEKIDGFVNDTTLYRTTVTTKIGQKEESEANHYAAFILMPEALIKKDLEMLQKEKFTQEDLTAMAKEYQTSAKALEIRLKMLDLI